MCKLRMGQFAKTPAPYYPSILCLLMSGFSQTLRKYVQSGPPTFQAYAAVLQQQAKDSRQSSTGKACFGTSLPEEKLNDFRDEQIGQLQELMQEATKPNRQFSITESKNQTYS
ncbi:hypothetical protein A6R68_17297 [Neotoma lepida]|uniref:Succinate dehydrogenase assembly factor 3 n=1 Tax=Neotoma lepida TaxID=56216 RepID=A0A1A6HDA0_NEOLE|nr:hypothetical protein A6R68_17297 [Neotoma lepida]